MATFILRYTIIVQLLGCIASRFYGLNESVSQSVANNDHQA